MRKKGKIVSIVLSIMMLMQILAITSFAAQAPTNVHWAKDGDPNKFSDAELVFNLVNGIEVYKITLYKDNQKIHTRIGGYSSDTGDFYEDLIDVLEDYGSGSYTATVGTLSGISEDYSEEDDVPTLATSEMSDVLVWNGDINTSKNDTISSNRSDGTPKEETTATKETETQSKSDDKIIATTKTVEITDIYNNELFEIVAEKDASGSKSGTPSDASFFNLSPDRHYTYLKDEKPPIDENYSAGGYKYGLTTGKSGTVDVNGNRLSVNGSESLLSFYNGYALGDYGNLSNKIFDYVNGILYTLPENIEITLSGTHSGGPIYLFHAEEKIVNISGAYVSDYEVQKIYEIKLKKHPMITVKYDNSTIHFDQLPIIENGRTLVPLRAIFEKIGADVEWDGNTQTVKATKGETTISLTINNTTAYKNGQAITLDVPAKILNGRTLVPVRFVADCFGVDVQWVQETQTVLLTSK